MLLDSIATKSKIMIMRNIIIITRKERRFTKEENMKMGRGSIRITSIYSKEDSISSYEDGSDDDTK